MSKEHLPSSKHDEQPEVKTVMKDNKLNVLAIGSTVYIPYIVIQDDIYEVRECIIESIGDIVENGVITIFYKCKFTWDSSSEWITLNILASVFTSYEEANAELKEFLSKQVTALEEHTSSLKEQLTKQTKHIKMFTKKLTEKKAK